MLFGYGLGMAVVFTIPFARPGGATLHQGANAPVASIGYAPSSLPDWLDPTALRVDSTNGKGQADLPAEKVFKNIVIFKGKPASQVLGAMRFINMSLGVTCEFCHIEKDFASDEKPAKLTARSMYYMAEKINNQNFSAQSVTCYTCHGGRRRPLISPVITDNRPGAPTEEGGAVKSGTVGTLTLENVLAMNAKAVGGEAAIKGITALQIDGNEVHADGRAATFQALLKAPNKSLLISSVEKPNKGKSLQAFNGNSGWMRFNDGEPRDLQAESAEQARRFAEIVPGANLRQLYPDLAVWGRDSGIGHNYMVLGGTSANGTRERLYFDASTGLLIRRYVEYKTMLGYIPFTIEYGDYKPVNGVKIPTTVYWKTTRDAWTDTYTSVRANVTLEDAIFAKPQVERPKK